MLLYRAILSVWARVMACETEWRKVDRNLAEAVVSDCACSMVASCVLPLILRCFFSTLVVVISSVVLRVTTEYVLMEFPVLSLMTISSKNGSSSESEEHRLLYPLEVGIGAAWFVRRRRFFSIRASGTLESSRGFKI